MPGSRIRRSMQARILKRPIVAVSAAALLVLLVAVAVNVQFYDRSFADADRDVHRAAVGSDGGLYYLLETTEGSNSVGDRSLWRSDLETGESVALSLPVAEMCDGRLDLTDLHRSGSSGIAVTAQCLSGGSFRSSIWEYQEPDGRFREVYHHEHEDWTVPESLSYQGGNVVYRIRHVDTACAEVHVESIGSGPVEEANLTDVLLDLSPLDVPGIGCDAIPGIRFEADDRDGLWFSLASQGAQTICRFSYVDDGLSCGFEGRKECSLWRINSGGTSLACGSAPASSDGLSLSLIEIESKEATAIEIDSGFWIVTDKDTILVLGDTLEIAEYGVR